MGGVVRGDPAHRCLHLRADRPLDHRPDGWADQGRPRPQRHAIQPPAGHRLRPVLLHRGHPHRPVGRPLQPAQHRRRRNRLVEPHDRALRAGTQFRAALPGQGGRGRGRGRAGAGGFLADHRPLSPQQGRPRDRRLSDGPVPRLRAQCRTRRLAGRHAGTAPAPGIPVGRRTVGMAGDAGHRRPAGPGGCPAVPDVPRAATTRRRGRRCSGPGTASFPVEEHRGLWIPGGRLLHDLTALQRGPRVGRGVLHPDPRNAPSHRGTQAGADRRSIRLRRLRRRGPVRRLPPPERRSRRHHPLLLSRHSRAGAGGCGDCAHTRSRLLDADVRTAAVLRELGVPARRNDVATVHAPVHARPDQRDLPVHRVPRQHGLRKHIGGADHRLRVRQRPDAALLDGDRRHDQRPAGACSSCGACCRSTARPWRPATCPDSCRPSSPSRRPTG